LSVMTVSYHHKLSRFTQITSPGDEKRVDSAPYMDYDNTPEEDIEDDDDYDYDDYNDIRMVGRLRQVIKSCEFIDLTALGPICNTGKKIKYYKVENDYRNLSTSDVFLRRRLNPGPNTAYSGMV
jgi:hypothetical protein